MSVNLASAMGLNSYGPGITQSAGIGNTPFLGALDQGAQASRAYGGFGSPLGSHDMAYMLLTIISQMLTMLMSLMGGLLGGQTSNYGRNGNNEGNNEGNNGYGNGPPKKPVTPGGGNKGGTGNKIGNLTYPMGRDGKPIPLNDHGNQGNVMKWGGSIKSASQKTGVPASLIAAMIDQESGGNARAASTNPGNGQTDSGLMQINPGTLKDLQAKHPELQGLDMSNPDNQILASSTLMGDYLKEYNGDVGKALRKYNSGTVPADIHTGPGGTDPDYIMSVIGHQPLYENLDT